MELALPLGLAWLLRHRATRRNEAVPGAIVDALAERDSQLARIMVKLCLVQLGMRLGYIEKALDLAHRTSTRTLKAILLPARKLPG